MKRFSRISLIRIPEEICHLYRFFKKKIRIFSKNPSFFSKKNLRTYLRSLTTPILIPFGDRTFSKSEPSFELGHLQLAKTLKKNVRVEWMKKLSIWRKILLMIIEADCFSFFFRHISQI